MSGPVLIFDTETTDKDEGREIIEAAWIRPAAIGDLAGPSDMIPRPFLAHPVEHFERRYQPKKPISFGAMAVHHILPSELEGCWPSEVFSLPEGVEYLIGHNITFDYEAIGKPPGIKLICTDAMARYIWQDADSYSQSALLYMLLGATPETRQRLQGAHSALTDVMNNMLLLEQILLASPVAVATWSELYHYSEQCRIPRVLPFGKHKGMPLDELVDYDPGYVDWCLRQDWLDEYLRKGLLLALNPPAAPAPEEAAEALDDDIPF